MGYCAKARIYSHIYCVIALFVSDQVKDVHGASAGGSWPYMKTYDIWGSAQTKAGPVQRSGTLTTSNDLELHDYRGKTSFRNEKGMVKKTVLILLGSFHSFDDLKIANRRNVISYDTK